MTTVFDVVAFNNLKESYEPYFEASVGLAASLAQAVGYIERAGLVALHDCRGDGNGGAIVRERVIGQMDEEGVESTVATYDASGKKLEGHFP